MSYNAKRILSTGLFAVLSLSSLTAFAGLQVSGAQLREANGQNFIMRGVNLPHAWYVDRTSQSLKDISATGANTVRVVLSNGKIWRRKPASEVAEIIRVAKEEGLITVLEVHDTTGLGEQTAATLSEAVDYWVSLRDVLVGQEDYVIINIGNEPYGNGQPASAWLNGHGDAIARLRREGFEHVLMVDAANWGQDWEGIMRSNAQALMDLDAPRRRLVFSVHMYEVYPNDSAVNGYLGAFRSMNLPLLVGEFAADHFGAFVDANAIMARAQQYGVGYLGWSWSGNSANLSSLDVVQNFDASRLTPWGSQLINGQNGIRATSRKATIFSTDGGCTATPIAPHLRVFTTAWGAWQRASAATLSRGQRVQLAPQPTAGGSWSWSGCGSSGSARAQTLSPTQSCTATAIHNNACGARSSQSFQITVTGNPPSGGGRCTMTVSSEWNEGYTAQVRIRNTGTAPIHGWQVGWSFGDGSRVSNHWNAELSGGNPYSAAPVSWNRSIQPGQQAEFGFNVNKGRPGTPAVPVAVTGGVCN